MQERRLFPDSKTFADAVPKRSPDAIVADFEAGAFDDDALRAFVAANFVLPSLVDDPAGSTAGDLRSQIDALWSVLERPAVEADGGSRIAFPRPHVVPGGRFRELYYWDSYFTMLGLAKDGRTELIEAMIGGFTGLIERFGHVPNGTRSYYLSRSQPPVFHLMLGLSPTTDARHLAALIREHDFWMRGGRVVRMPDGALLNRYWDDRAGPRDESWYEDMATAASAGRSPQEIGRELRAAAESGWDFSSRWLGDGRTLETIRTTRLVPADLNALLFGLERTIAKLDGPNVYADRAEARKQAISTWLWSEEEARFGDWDLDAQRLNTGLTAATLAPLFTGVASQDQADLVAGTVERSLLAPGGLRTTRVETGQQWDQPNGWAPLQWIAVRGLRDYGHADLAAAIADRWIATVETAWRETGFIYEKYDVERGGSGGAGEYAPQTGFGWTNGVTRALQSLPKR